MIGFFNNENTPVSDNLLFGQNALTNNVGGVGTINHLEIRNCKARHIFATKTTTTTPTTTPPSDSTWYSDYIMNDDLGHNVQAGNAGQALLGLTSLLVRRKIANDINAPWVTLFDIPVDQESINEGINFTVKDYFARSGTKYFYALIPLIQNGNTIIQGTENAEDPESEPVHQFITPQYDSLFICSRTNFVRLIGTLSYDDLNTIQSIGVHETLGNQYPIVVSNSQVNYQTGGLSATILNKDFVDNMSSKAELEVKGIDTNVTEFNREKLRLAREEFEAFITEQTPKIIKDMNGNMWLAMITDSPTYSFYNNWGMGLGDIHLSWTQIGDVDNEDDLQAAGMIGGVNTEE